MKVRYESIVLILATLLLGVFITLFIQKNSEVKKYRSKVGLLETTIVIKNDTIDYLKKRIEESDKKATDLSDIIATFKPRIETIYIEADKYSTSEKYDAIQTILGDKLDSLTYPFSGNQVDSIYVHEEERFLYMAVLTDYESLVGEMRESIGQRDSLTSYLSEQNLTQKNKIFDLSQDNKNCNYENVRLKKSNRIFIGTTGGLIILLAMALI